MQTFVFKESLLQRTMFMGFTIVLATLITVACFVQVGNGFSWLLGGIAAGTVLFTLIYFLYQSYRGRQTFTVTNQSITSRSKARGSIKIFWANLTEVKTAKGRISDVRERVPGLEILITSYVMLPSTGDNRTLGTLYLRDNQGNTIFVRQYLVYPSTLDNLIEAIEAFSPVSSPLEQNYN